MYLILTAHTVRNKIFLPFLTSAGLKFTQNCLHLYKNVIEMNYDDMVHKSSHTNCKLYKISVYYFVTYS